MTHKFLQVLVAVLLVSVVDSTRTHGATIDVDTILGPDHPYFDQTITVVDGLEPPTELTILPGTHVGESLGGPLIEIGVEAYGQSVVRLFSGGINGASVAVLLHDQSVFHMFDGDLGGHIEAHDSSEVIVDNGFWRGVIASETSLVRINFSPPGHEFRASLFGESHTVITGGDVRLFADEQSTVVIRGGFFPAAVASGDTTWLVLDGFFEDGLQVDSGVVSIRGIETEEFGIGALRVGGATVHVYGTGLHFESAGGIDKIVGALADGDPFNAAYELSPVGQIILHEVPEPAAASLALAAAAAALAASARRRRAQ